MSKRKRIQNNKKKKKNKITKKSDKPFVIGDGIFMVLFFLWIQFSNSGDINESELLTISGNLNSELIKESTGGARQTYFWTFLIENQPVKFSISNYAKMSFDSKIFKKTESNQSEITVKVDKEFYEKSIKNSKNKTVGVKYLASKNRKYFNLKDYNKNKETDMKLSYIFLIIGIGGIIYGLIMKK
ncbi:hypothetical protein [Tenacibaculum finnmarkense]|uniref:hypothetical protein n=1 Tax=Tenacibaculum finnmarkense TaxID=2781243 RepID=UPI001E5154DC|nr:hypothetical protein [Tenacibaculum finnmarkense]MCD8448065.1 hypothetical protein [Tenacibaculum finnmarkense genomovar finnmarkense]